jgi:Phytanoyl-CoA dioxygenase (PhyH)
MNINLQEFDSQQLEAAAQHYADRGFLLLSGLENLVTARFRPVLAEKIGVDEHDLLSFLDPENPKVVFSPEVRKRLGRVDTSRSLALSLLRVLEPLLTRLIGPLAHVSSNFHAQFKGDGVKAVDHGGYATGDYMEVHGPYLLHQDFAGASIPTSPSAVTLWVAMNDCPCWNLRLYPGSHRLGLLCNRWVGLEDERLAPFGEPIDVPAQAGTAVVFNALMLHGTSNPGPLRRVSCDIRFFPLCGFLPSETHLLGSSPYSAIREGLAHAFNSVLQAPLLEDQVFLGEKTRLEHVPPLSVLNWVKYLSHVVNGEAEEALPYLERFVNTAIGFDGITAYVSKFHKQPVHEEALLSVRERLACVAPHAA